MSNDNYTVMLIDEGDRRELIRDAEQQRLVKIAQGESRKASRLVRLVSVVLQSIGGWLVRSAGPCPEPAQSADETTGYRWERTFNEGC